MGRLLAWNYRIVREAGILVWLVQRQVWRTAGMGIRNVLRSTSVLLLGHATVRRHTRCSGGRRGVSGR